MQNEPFLDNVHVLLCSLITLNSSFCFVVFISQEMFMLWILLRFCSRREGEGYAECRQKQIRRREGFSICGRPQPVISRCQKLADCIDDLFSNWCCIFPGVRWSACKSSVPPSPTGLFTSVALISGRIMFHRPVWHLFLLTIVDKCPHLSSTAASQVARSKLYWCLA